MQEKDIVLAGEVLGPEDTALSPVFAAAVAVDIRAAWLLPGLRRRWAEGRAAKRIAFLLGTARAHEANGLPRARRLQTAVRSGDGQVWGGVIEDRYAEYPAMFTLKHLSTPPPPAAAGKGGVPAMAILFGAAGVVVASALAVSLFSFIVRTLS